MLKNLVNIAILTTIVIAVWVSVSIYASFTSNTITTNVAKQIEPIEPNFNKSALSNLQQRTFIPTDLSEKITLPTPSDKENTGSTSAQPSPQINQSVAQEVEPSAQPSVIPTISNQ